MTSLHLKFLLTITSASKIVVSVVLQMEASLKRELQTASEGREKFIKEFSEEDYNYIVNGWQVFSISNFHISRRNLAKRSDEGLYDTLNHAWQWKLHSDAWGAGSWLFTFQINTVGSLASTVQDKLDRLDEQKWGLFTATKQAVEE